MQIDVRLYGPLARYGGSDRNIHAKVLVELDAGKTLADLLDTSQVMIVI